MGFVVVGIPGNRRVELFQEALHGLALPPARVVSYADLLAGRTSLPDVVHDGDVVRIESSGKDWEVERALLRSGADIEDAPSFERLSVRQVEALAFERGRIWPMRQWYLGWRMVLDDLRAQLGRCPPHRLMMVPDEIATMFDKAASHALLSAAGVPVAPALLPLTCFDDLVEQMRARRWARVFVKATYGSSASGAVALHLDTRHQQAISTVEMVHGPDGLRLYNSRRLQTYRSLAEIRRLIDALCRHGVHVERWLPKAGIAGRTFDLRVVVIGGTARHVVVRLSRGPMTNLHLLNQRGDVEAVVQRMGAEAYEAALASAERAMTCFPRSLYGGIDLLIEAGYRRHAVLEVNAFGDLLPGSLWHDQDTYRAEILALDVAEAVAS